MLVLKNMAETKINVGTGMAKKFKVGANTNPVVMAAQSKWAEKIVRLNLAQLDLL